jgi:YfiH family protein
VSRLTHLRVPGWDEIPGLTHGFLGRTLSPDPTTGPGDPFRDVKKAIDLAGRVITTVRQTHGDQIIDVRAPAPEQAGEADALATADPGVFLGIFTADCVPVLIVDAKRRVCAAVHAGWRGTLANISGRVVAHLSWRYGCDSMRLRAAIGPAIERCCFEVGPEVVRAFHGSVDDLDPFCEPHGEKAKLDLRGLNRLALLDAGIPPDAVSLVGPCVACGGDDFYSYRRDREAAGRQLSFVGFVS